MKNKQSLKQTVSPNITLLHAQLQSLQILSMDVQTLDRFLEDEHMENPLLDLDSVLPVENTALTLGEYFQNTDYSEKGNSLAFNQGSTELEPVQEEFPSLSEHLCSQIQRQILPPELASLIEALIYRIDPHTGYFSESPSKLQKLLGCNEAVLNQALSYIHEMEPSGIGAFSLSDSLKIQLHKKKLLNPDLEYILDHFLEELASGKLNIISRSLHISTEKIKHYLRLIRTCTPYPAGNFGSLDSLYIVPDLRARFENGKWDIQLCNSRQKEIRLNTLYIQIAKNAEEKELQNYFQEKIERAKNIIRAVKQRENTLLKLAEFVLTTQTEFALGTGPLHSLSMRVAADVLHISPSTVSRAVAGKYIELPSGTYPLKKLLCVAPQEHSIVTSSSDRQEKFIEQLNNIILSEDSTHPFSDQKIADILSQNGFATARRTVSKYREIAGIPSASNRKKKKE